MFIAAGLPIPLPRASRLGPRACGALHPGIDTGHRSPYAVLYMARSRFAVVPLVALLAAACAAPVRVARSVDPVETPRTVEEYWPNGQLSLRKQVVVVADGSTVDHGRFERWYSNGVKEYEAVLEMGNKEGTTIRYHRNGRIASRDSYRNGLRDGPSVSWSPSGEKVKEEYWAEGRPHGTWTVWKNGAVEWTHTFHHGDPAP